MDKSLLHRGGDIYILPKGYDHFYFSDEKNPWTKIWFNIKGPLIDNLMQTYRLNNIYHIKNLDLQDLFYKMFFTAQNTDRTVEETYQKASIIFHKILLKIYTYLGISKKMK